MPSIAPIFTTPVPPTPVTQMLYGRSNPGSDAAVAHADDAIGVLTGQIELDRWLTRPPFGMQSVALLLSGLLLLGWWGHRDRADPSHVAAKRYLCSDRLSESSRRSFKVQRATMTADEIAAFLGQPAARDAIEMRKIDDLDKERGGVVPRAGEYPNC